MKNSTPDLKADLGEGRPVVSDDRTNRSNRLFKAFLAVIASLFVSYFVYGIWLDSRLIQTLDSPSGNYSVRLFGQKERPILLTVSIYFEVLKGGKSYWNTELLHSGDAMDLSFELGWPESRWVQENVVEFYRPEDLAGNTGDQLEVVNLSERPLKHLRIESGSKVLAFDIEPGASVLVAIPKAKGDYCSTWMEAHFVGPEPLRTSDSQQKDSGNCALRRFIIREDGIKASI